MHQKASLAGTMQLLRRLAPVGGDTVNLTCFESLEAAETVWRDFQKTAATTVYHSFQWSDAWLATHGSKHRIEPRIIAGRNSHGQLLFILPLQIRRKWGISTLEFLGAPDVQFGYGLFDRAFLASAPRWFDSNLSRVLAAAGTFHIVSLLDMPHELNGFEHPLARQFSITCANDSFSLQLCAQYEELYERKRNAESRRANRRKDNRLAELGEIKFYQPSGKAELHRAIDVMLEHKIKRLAENGIHGVFDDAQRRMTHRLADEEEQGKPLFSTHVLSIGGEIQAVTFGGHMDGTYWFNISSLAPDNAATKHSPGDLALRKTIKMCCEQGLEVFDFGPGMASYKEAWTDSVMHLFGIVRSNSLVGLPWVIAKVIKLNFMGLIKRTTWMRRLAFALRKKTRGRD